MALPGEGAFLRTVGSEMNTSRLISTLILMLTSVVAGERNWLELERREDPEKFRVQIVEQAKEEPTILRVLLPDGSEAVMNYVELTDSSQGAVDLELTRLRLGVPADFQGLWISHSHTSSFNGRFHYWFNCQNFRITPFNGKMRMTLREKVRVEGLTFGEREFHIDEDIAQGSGFSRAITSLVGPPIANGESSVTGAKIELFEEGEIIYEIIVPVPDQVD